MANDSQIELGKEDRAAIDALMAARFNPSAVAVELRDRATRVSNLLRLLDTLGDEQTGDLLAARTLQAVQTRRVAHVRAAGQTRRGGIGLGLGVRLHELATIAAMILLSMSLLWPMLANARGAAMQYACQGNLGSAGMALLTYADTSNGRMPSVPMKLGDPWWLTDRFDEEGYAQSNSAHLFQLARLGFASVETLGCPCSTPGNCRAPDLSRDRDWSSGRAVSFSYQNQYTRDRPRLGRGKTIAVLADKNPFFIPGRYLFQRGLAHREDAVSENHSERGGHNALLSDGTVRWLHSPMLGDDNIYHVGDGGLDNYTGLEGPRDEGDSFLVY